MWTNRLNNISLNPYNKDLKPAPWRDGFNSETFTFKPDIGENGRQSTNSNSYDQCSHRDDCSGCSLLQKKIKNNTCNQANNVDNRNQQEGQDFHKKDFRGERK